jgi:hypothetical protein
MEFRLAEFDLEVFFFFSLCTSLCMLHYSLHSMMCSSFMYNGGLPVLLDAKDGASRSMIRLQLMR